MAFLVNKYLTPLTDELLDSLDKEVRDDLIDSITSIEYIRNLISSDRKRAKDLPRDEYGRIIVDLANPHILEDMDYFRPTALYFKLHRVFTHLKPNPNPNSEFMKWLNKEIDRCWNGMVRESDGEWVPGDLYFYLNYMPIFLALTTTNSKKAYRVEDFPDMWEGIYLWFHYMYQARERGLHCVLIARRGASKSYSAAAMLAKRFILGENKDVNKEVRGIAVAFKSEFLTKDGIINKFINCADFCAENTQFPSRRLKSSMQEMTWKMGYLDSETQLPKGTLNETLGISTKDDSSKVRGKRAQFIFLEEFGAFPNFLDTWNTLIPSVQDGEYAFGLMAAVGTGGEEGNNFTGALEIIYNPIGYNVYPLPNVYDRNAQGKTNTVYFFGGYMNRKGFYNKDGVSDVTGALISILKDRMSVKYNSTDPMALTRRKAEIPITIQDAIMQVTSTIYPVADLTDRLNLIDLDPKSLDDVLVGELYMRNGEVEFRPEPSIPVRNFPHKDNKQDGAVEIFKLPELDRNGRPFKCRYIFGIDPFDDDASKTLSLGAIKCLDTWTDRIVAQYTGRRKYADEFFEICRRLILFYNGEALYENNKKGLFAYFSKMNSLYLLADCPEFLRDKDMVKGELYGNKIKGAPSTAPIKSYGRRAVRDWLLKPMVTIVTNEDGDPEEVTEPLLMHLKSRALIQELTMWNPDINADEHDALVMLMLLREDRMIIDGDTTENERRNSYDDSDYIGNDEYFFKNYDRRFKNKDVFPTGELNYNG